MARTPQSTRTCTMRSSEHAAHRPLMHSVHIALVAQGLALCVIHVIHACAPVSGLLSVLFLVSLSFYFFFLFLFQLYLMSTSAPDELSVENPLCDSSLGSMVTSDYVTPLTLLAVMIHHFLEECVHDKPLHTMPPETYSNDFGCFWN